MHIKITIEAVDEDDNTIIKQQGEISAKESALSIRQWCIETYTSVKMAAIAKVASK